MADAAVVAVAKRIAARVSGRPSGFAAAGALVTLSAEERPQNGHAASVARK